jgi:hypothetical protein
MRLILVFYNYFLSNLLHIDMFLSNFKFSIEIHYFHSKYLIIAQLNFYLSIQELISNFNYFFIHFDFFIIYQIFNYS